MSPLLRLPSELRTYIWEYSFIGVVVIKMDPPGQGPEPYRNIQSNIDQATGLLRACIQARHEALPSFRMYCTFDLDRILNWPLGDANNVRLAIEAVKDIQLAKISEDAVRQLIGQDGPVRLISRSDWTHSARKKLLASFASLRHVTVDNSCPSVLPYPPKSSQEVRHYAQEWVVSYARATVHGIRHIFNNDNLDVVLSTVSEDEDVN